MFTKLFLVTLSQKSIILSTSGFLSCVPRRKRHPTTEDAAKRETTEGYVTAKYNMGKNALTH